MEYIKNHKYGIEELSKKYYGCTNMFEFAGYLLEDGNMLNFSYDGIQRTEDHRNVGFFFSKAQGTVAMLKFMRRGNIRCMCNSQGYRFEFIKKPTKEQVSRLQKSFKYCYSSDKLLDFEIEKSDNKGKHKLKFYDVYSFMEYYENSK